MSLLHSSRFLAVATVACAAFTGARAQQVIVLKDGVAAIQLSSPEPQNLASGAALNLKLPSASMNAQATASIGQDTGSGSFWHKDAAQLGAQIQGPLGSSFSATGEHQLSLEYRAPADAAPQTADHLVRSENQTASAQLTAPLGGVQITAGAQHSATVSQDMSGSEAESPVVGTQDHSIFARMNWRPLGGVDVAGGATARTSAITWRGGTERSSSYHSLDPDVSVGVRPWQGAKLSAKLEHVVSPYDAGAFAAYSTDQAPNAPALRPDHAWQLETRLEQDIGATKLSAAYTASRQGSATELVAGQGATQSPASTPLLRRDNLSVGVSVPLDAVGLAGASVSSQAQWQTSRVVDPVTQEQRAASGEVPRKFSLRVAHALADKRLSLGLTGDFTGACTTYQVNQISTTSSGGSLGAFMAFTPGRYQIDLNVSGIVGSSTTDYMFPHTRQASEPDRVLWQPNTGPMLSLSLHKQL